MIAVKCIRCDLELDEPGAILLGPPNDRHTVVDMVSKRHLCIRCYMVVLDRILDDRIDIEWTKLSAQ